MKKLNKSEFLSWYSSHQKNVEFVTEDNDYWGNDSLVRFYPGGDHNKVMSALPEDTIATIYSYSEKVARARSISPLFSMNNSITSFRALKEKEDEGDEYFFVYIKDLFSWREKLVKDMFPYFVSDKIVRRSLGKNACKMLELLGKDIKGVQQYVDNDYYCGRTGYSTLQEYNEALSAQVTSYHQYLKRELRKSPLLDCKQYSFDDAIFAWLSAYKKEQAEKKRAVKAQKKEQEKAQKIFDKEQEAIGRLLDGAASWYDAESIVVNTFRTGEHKGLICGHFSSENNVTCEEESDRNGYSRSCRYPLITRSFTLEIKKGWRMRKVGGILTFYRGKFNRDGMKVEWVEQGKAIADFSKHTGFLVRGEHIEAESLKAAKRINEEHRAMKLARLLNSRKRAERRAEEKENGELNITFSDSLKAGNCRPGTQEFKNKYEVAIGHSAKSISIKDLRKYAKEFGVEYYAEQAIEYALNH